MQLCRLVIALDIENIYTFFSQGKLLKSNQQCEQVRVV